MKIDRQERGDFFPVKVEAPGSELRFLKPEADYIDAEFEPIETERVGEVRRELKMIEAQPVNIAIVVPVEKPAREERPGLLATLFGIFLDLLPGLKEYEEATKQFNALLGKGL